MATPTAWLAEFQVNTGFAATGTHDNPKILGLANGRILVVWEEATTGVASSAGPDMVAKILDAEGGVVKDSFQLNALRAFDDEHDFDIAANSLGGWVMSYVDHDTGDPNETSIVWELFSDGGSFRAGDQIDVETTAADNLSNPQLALDLTVNDFVLVYDDLTAGDANVFGRFVNFVTAAGLGFNTSSEFAGSQNATDIQDQVEITILANGNYATVYREYDGAVPGLDIRIFQSDGTFVGQAQNIAVNVETPQISALANGNLVIVWRDTSNDQILGRIYSNTGASVSAQFTVADTVAIESEPDVIALPDGGFVVAWSDDSAGQKAQFYNSDGTANGDAFLPGSGTTSKTDISVTTDGRVLFTWMKGGDVFASIWDPRGEVIEVSDFSSVRTNFLATEDVLARREGGTINGTDNANELTGLEGVDILNGNGGQDTLIGGANNDTLDGGADADDMTGGTGDDTYIVDDIADGVTENTDEGTDQVTTDLASYTLTDNVENLRYSGTGMFTGTGNALDNSIFGADNADILLGGDGADTLFGGNGGDTLDGGLGADTLGGGGGDDILNGGDDSDLLKGSLGDDTLNGDDGADNLRGEQGDDTLNGGQGDDLLRGGRGLDILTGGTGDDALKGFAENDELAGGAGADILRGGRGDDVLNGDGGADQLFGLKDDDVLKGGAGKDQLKGGLGDDRLVGGDGTDTALFKGGIGRYDIVETRKGLKVTDTKGKFGQDVLIGIEKLQFDTETYKVSKALSLAAQVSDIVADVGPDADLVTSFGDPGDVLI